MPWYMTWQVLRMLSGLMHLGDKNRSPAHRGTFYSGSVLPSQRGRRTMQGKGIVIIFL